MQPAEGRAESCLVFRLRSRRKQLASWFGDLQIELPAIDLIFFIPVNYSESIFTADLARISDPF